MLGLFLLGECFVFFPDLVEFGHVLGELRTFLQSNEQLCLLAVSSVSLNCDGSGLNFLEDGIVVSKGDRLRYFVAKEGGELTLRGFQRQ